MYLYHIVFFNKDVLVLKGLSKILYFPISPVLDSGMHTLYYSTQFSNANEKT